MLKFRPHIAAIFYVFNLIQHPWNKATKRAFGDRTSGFCWDVRETVENVRKVSTLVLRWARELRPLSSPLAPPPLYHGHLSTGPLRCCVVPRPVRPFGTSPNYWRILTQIKRSCSPANRLSPSRSVLIIKRRSEEVEHAMYNNVRT